MTRIPYDQFYKQFLEEFLSPLGTVARSREVPGEARQVDIYFSPDPHPQEDPQTLGLLGQIAATPCLLEPFSDQPTLTEVRNCLLKLFLVQAELHRQAKREGTRLTETELPQLWILAAAASEQLTTSFAAIPREDWATGVYFLATALKTAVIAINQLPLTAATVWLRLLGRGKTQQQAIAEVLSFAKADPR